MSGLSLSFWKDADWAMNYFLLQMQNVWKFWCFHSLVDANTWPKIDLSHLGRPTDVLLKVHRCTIDFLIVLCYIHIFLTCSVWAMSIMTKNIQPGATIIIMNGSSPSRFNLNTYYTGTPSLFPQALYISTSPCILLLCRSVFSLLAFKAH